ncbi:MAG: hypothetical protein V4857_11175 [Pseudomonadota bacterium]
MDAQHFAHFVANLLEWTADAPAYIPPTVSDEDKPVLSAFNNRIAAVRRLENRLASVCTVHTRNDMPDDEPDFEPLEASPIATGFEEAVEPEVEEGDDGIAVDKRIDGD